MAERDTVLVLGNYLADGQRSMQRFAELQVTMLRAAGLDAALLRPARVLGRVGRWGALADKYLLFPPRLRRAARRVSLVHIADHANAPYARWCGTTPRVVSCHDLLAVAALDGGEGGARLSWCGRWLQRWVRAALRRERVIACVSDATATAARRLLGAGPRLAVVPNAVTVSEGAAAARERPFFLHVGGNQFYKNRPGVVRLFDALAALPRFAAHRLVLVGAAPDAALAAAIAAAPHRARIEVMVGCDDAAVVGLYRAAAALLFVSTAEGFGWPILEAQACGCPVVTSDRAPLRDVAGGAAELVDPDAPAAAAARVAAADFAPLRAAGYRNAARYAPDAIWPQWRALYEDVLGRPLRGAAA